MKKIQMYVFITLISFFIILFTSSCSLKQKYQFKNLIDDYNIKHLEYKNLKYFYSHVVGFEDHYGLKYFFFEFDEYPEDFILQFEDDYKFNDYKDLEFEDDLMDEIETSINSNYDEIDEKYKINFVKEYMFSNFPMIYFKQTNQLVIINFVNIR